MATTFSVHLSRQSSYRRRNECLLWPFTIISNKIGTRIEILWRVQCIRVNCTKWLHSRPQSRYLSTNTTSVYLRVGTSTCFLNLNYNTYDIFAGKIRLVLKLLTFTDLNIHQHIRVSILFLFDSACMFLF